jgi:endonuclease III-like uncharacterized protein
MLSIKNWVPTNLKTENLITNLHQSNKNWKRVEEVFEKLKQGGIIYFIFLIIKNILLYSFKHYKKIVKKIIIEIGIRPSPKYFYNVVLF